MAMPYKTILVANSGPACVITLNRPDKRNAMNMLMKDELIVALKDAEGQSNVHAVIITGGEQFFSTGGDLNEVLQIKTAMSGLRDFLNRWHLLTATIEELARPVIAAIEGFCFTGGLELALACDVRVASEGSSFAMTSAKIGTVAGGGGTQRLPRIIGLGNALDLLLSAEPVDAKEAYRIGLINRLCPRGTALETAKTMARVYAERAPVSLRLLKRAVHRGTQMDLVSALEFESFLVATVYGTEDKQEGISAFLEKRRPAFKGK